MASESDTQRNDANGTADGATASPASTLSQPGRRRAMLRTLGATGPVVMTLVSNPVSACTCVVASSYVSALALASRSPTSSNPCSGRTPAAWQANAAGWPSPYCGAKTASADLTNFKKTFGTTGGTSLTESSTLLDALGPVSGTYGTLANYCVAALLNAQSNKVSSTILSTSQIFALWRNITTLGYYQPSKSSRVKFTPQQTVTWLAAMMA